MAWNPLWIIYWHLGMERRKECMEKGRRRMPGSLAWASERTAGGDYAVAASWTSLADHPETCTKSQAILSVIRPWLELAPPFYFLEGDSSFCSSHISWAPTMCSSLSHWLRQHRHFEQSINSSFVAWQNKILSKIINLYELRFIICKMGINSNFLSEFL